MQNLKQKLFFLSIFDHFDVIKEDMLTFSQMVNISFQNATLQTPVLFAGDAVRGFALSARPHPAQH